MPSSLTAFECWLKGLHSVTCRPQLQISLFFLKVRGKPCLWTSEHASIRYLLGSAFAFCTWWKPNRLVIFTLCNSIFLPAYLIRLFYQGLYFLQAPKESSKLLGARALFSLRARYPSALMAAHYRCRYHACLQIRGGVEQRGHVHLWKFSLAPGVFALALPCCGAQVLWVPPGAWVPWPYSQEQNDQPARGDFSLNRSFLNCPPYLFCLQKVHT